MLVLTRRIGGKVVLADPEWGYQIVVEVVGVRHDRTRLGLTAPPQVTVWREELGHFAGNTRSARQRKLKKEGAANGDG